MVASTNLLTNLLTNPALCTFVHSEGEICTCTCKKICVCSKAAIALQILYKSEICKRGGEDLYLYRPIGAGLACFWMHLRFCTVGAFKSFLQIGDLYLQPQSFALFTRISKKIYTCKTNSGSFCNALLLVIEKIKRNMLQLCVIWSFNFFTL